MKLVDDEAAPDKASDCWVLTDFDTFVSHCGSEINFLTDMVTSYLSFCCDMHLTIKVFPNIWKAIIQL